MDGGIGGKLPRKTTENISQIWRRIKKTMIWLEQTGGDWQV